MNFSNLKLVSGNLREHYPLFYHDEFIFLEARGLSEVCGLDDENIYFYNAFHC
jgi:hypothetical protein